MHCFGGNWEQARRSLDLGFLVSFAGNLTYPKAQPLRDVAARLPLDGILVETDAPWLAPAPIAASATSRPGSGRRRRFGRIAWRRKRRNRLRDHEKLQSAVSPQPDVGN
jgi:Tat protein secretion system quality control protein TatD with DNase activity